MQYLAANHRDHPSRPEELRDGLGAILGRSASQAAASDAPGLSETGREFHRVLEAVRNGEPATARPETA